MANTTYNSTEDMIDKLQSLRGKTNIKFHKNIGNYYDNIGIRMDEGPFSKNAQSIVKIYHEVLLIMNFLQTKPQVKNMNIKYYDFYYTVFKNRDEKKFINAQYEKDYINFSDITPNHYIGRRNDNTLLM